MKSARLASLLAGMWAGMLLCMAAVATPAPFALLAREEAGRVVARILAQEAYLSLAVAVILLGLERWQTKALAGGQADSTLNTNVVLILATLFCTIAGYFAVQPMMAAARLGQGAWSFGELHAVSGGLFALKGLLVLALAWRFTAAVKTS